MGDPEVHRVATPTSDSGSPASEDAAGNELTPAVSMRSVFAKVLAVYAVTRVLVALASWFAVNNYDISFHDLLVEWDGRFYLAIARHGYPPRVDVFSHALPAYFPGYPLLTRAVAVGTGMGYLATSLVVSTIAGAAMLIACSKLAVERWGQHVGTRAVVFLAIFPGSLFFSMPYADGLALAFAAWSMLQFERNKILSASTLSAAATLCSPLTIPLGVMFAWQAVKTRRKTAILATVIAPLGAVAYMGYLWVHFGSPFTWFEVQHDSFRHRFDLLAPVFAWRLGDGIRWVSCISLVFLGLALVAARRTKLQAPFALYGAVVMACIVFDRGQWAHSRFLLNAFPLVLAFGAWIAKRTFYPVLVLASGALIPILLVTYQAGHVLGPP